MFSFAIVLARLKGGLRPAMPSPPMVESPAVAAQQAVLSKQLFELKELRHSMQAMYDASQQEVVEVRTQVEEAQGEAARERERAAAIVAENNALRQWNEQLAGDMQRLFSALNRGDEASADPSKEAEEEEIAGLMNAAATLPPPVGPTGAVVDLAVLQAAQLEASTIAVRLAHANARLKRKGKELRASTSHVSQLQQTAQALSTDLAAATAQIGKLEGRIQQQAETAKRLEQLKADHAAQTTTLEKTAEALSRAKEETEALAKGPLAEAVRRVTDMEDRERRSRALLERKVRQASELAAAVQALGADSRLRIEENVKLRLLAQRLGATHKELEGVRRSSRYAREDAEDASDLTQAAAARVAAGSSKPPSSLSTAWIRRTDGDGAAGDGSDDPDGDYGGGSSPAGRRPPTYQGASSSLRGGSGIASSLVSLSPGGPVEALQSQMALQEKLRKVRSTFADLRRQVGYDE